MTTLGKTAGALFWMFRYLERSENLARMIDAGLRMTLTQSGESSQEWRSVMMTYDLAEDYEKAGNDYSMAQVVNYLLRGKDNEGSVVTMIARARDNARVARTAITREVWEATNECYMAVRERLSRPVREADLPSILGMIRQHSALVRGALHGTMLRNDTYNFARIGTFLERADNSARILDVKYYILLPSPSHIGSTLDTSQWDMLLRSLSAHRSYRWLHPNETRPMDVARFLILDQSLPRSVLFCTRKIDENLQWLASDYGETHECHHMAAKMREQIANLSIERIFELGLHEFLQDYMLENQALASQIESDYRFVS